MKKLIDLNAYPVKEMLPFLLQDKTTKENIIFATDIYSKNDNELFPTEHITEENLKIIDIQPRVAKSADEQNERTRSNAEVFTPSWICNKMNNYFDEEWFGKCEVFNTENEKLWLVNHNKIPFTVKKTWQDYVKTKVLEITCGEAPFLVSRYDSATGEPIAVEDRIGILDRKLRVVNENCNDQYEWFEWVKMAYQSTFGYEYQGDNLLIARINLLITFADYMLLKWHREPTKGELKYITNIIVWNIWQMDGLTGAQPLKEATENTDQIDMMSMFFDDVSENFNARIYSWSANKSFEFNDIKDGRKMKFDYVIGNPPYQEESMGESTGTNPVYHLYYDSCINIADQTLLITPARFLFKAGKTPKQWNEKMLNDCHFKVLFYSQNPQAVFPGVPLTGGVVVSSYNKNKEFYPIVNFVPYVELRNIISKVHSYKSFTSLREIIFVHSKFNLEKVFELNKKYKDLIGSEGKDRRVRANAFEKFNFFSSDKKDSSDIRVLGLVSTKRTYMYINSELLDVATWQNKYKVFVPESNGASGMLGEEAARIISKPVVGYPGDGVTQTFIVVGSFDSINEAENLNKYILSKFARCLLGSLKATQRNNSVTWANVPIQNFTDNSDIDWSKSIHEIDLQLYKKYNLSEEEIEFIETHVKEMA